MGVLTLLCYLYALQMEEDDKGCLMTEVTYFTVM